MQSQNITDKLKIEPVSRIMQVRLVVDQVSVFGFLPSSLMLQMPPVSHIDEIELRLVINHQERRIGDVS